jgi:hypothetical protein
MSSQSIKNLNDSSPAAQSGYQNGKWQQGSTTGNDPITGFPIFPSSIEIPADGGVSIKTGAYSIIAADRGLCLAYNSAGSAAFTLPSTPPVITDGNGNNRWRVAVTTINTGALTLTATSPAKLDGTTGGSIVFQQNTGALIFTDGTDYYTIRGANFITALTTNGNSGAATLALGVLNIPNYGLSVPQTTPVPRAFSGTNRGSAGPVTITLPTGSAVGDDAFIFCASSSTTTPASSGWVLQTRLSNSFVWQVYVYKKTLTSGDIAAGNASFTYSAGLDGFYKISLGCVAFTGSIGGIRDFAQAQISQGTSTTQTVSTGTTPIVGDYVLHYGTNSLDSGSIAQTISRGTNQVSNATLGNSDWAGLINSEILAASGSISTTFTTGSGSFNYGAYGGVLVLYGVGNATLMINPMTTAGDLIAGGASGAATRLGIGTDGYVLTADSAQTNKMKWATPPAGVFTSLTTTGSSGPSTLVAGVLNVPQYAGGGTLSDCVTRTSYSSAARATGTVYQNAGSYPLVVVGADGTAGTTAVSCLTDASNPPTSQTWAQVSLGGGNSNPYIFVVMPGHYYKLVGSGAGGWIEYVFNTGTWTASADLVGTRALSTNYHNTGTGVMILQVVMSGTSSGSTITVVCDSSATPTTTVYQMTAGGGSNAAFVMIPPGYYYKVTASAGSISHWKEYSSDVGCVQSANLFTSGQRAIAATTATPPVMYTAVNTSRKTKFVSVVFNDGGTGTSFFQTDDNIPPRTATWAQANNTSFVRSMIGFQMMFEGLIVRQDSNVITASTAWTEYTLG